MFKPVVLASCLIQGGEDRSRSRACHQPVQTVPGMHGGPRPEMPGTVPAAIHYRLKSLGNIIPVRIKKGMKHRRGKVDMNQADPLVSGNGKTAFLAGKKEDAAGTGLIGKSF